MEFRTTDFGLFKDLLGRTAWDTVLEKRGVQKSWLICKDHLLQAQERSILTSRKSSKGSRKPAWMNMELLTKLKVTKKNTEVEAGSGDPEGTERHYLNMLRLS